jgi:hypothetical protein
MCRSRRYVSGPRQLKLVPSNAGGSATYDGCSQRTHIKQSGARCAVWTPRRIQTRLFSPDLDSFIFCVLWKQQETAKASVEATAVVRGNLRCVGSICSRGHLQTPRELSVIWPLRTSSPTLSILITFSWLSSVPHENICGIPQTSPFSCSIAPSDTTAPPLATDSALNRPQPSPVIPF